MLNLAAREGLRNVRRDPALTVVLAGATALVLLLSAFVGAVGDAVTERMTEWESRVELVAFVPPKLGALARADLQHALEALPGVAAAAFTSSEESWRQFILEAGAPEDLVSADEVGLVPGAFVLRLRPGGVDPTALESLALQCRTLPHVIEVRYADELLSTYARFRAGLGRLMVLTIFLLAGLLVGLSTATMRLALGGRRTELRSWMLEGSTPGFLSVLFAVEGAVQGFLGSLVAAAVYVGGARLAAVRGPWDTRVSGTVLVAVLLCGPVLGVIAGWLATRRLGRLVAPLLIASVLAAGRPAGAQDTGTPSPPRTTGEYDVARQRRQLESFRRQREQTLADASQLVGQSLGLLGEIEAIGRMEDAVALRIQETQATSEQLQGDIGVYSERLAASEASYDTVARRVVRLSRALEWSQAPTALTVFLADTPQGAIIREQKTREVILTHRIQAFAELERAQRGLRRQRHALATAKAEADALAVSLLTDLETQALVRAERTAMLRAVQSEQAIAAATLAELAGTVHQLETLLGKLEEQPEAPDPAAVHYGPVPFPDLRGALPWPLAAAAVARPFGLITDPLFDTVTQHDGWLLTPGDDPTVRAIHDGVVRYVGWLHGYGKIVILAHGAGHQSLYGHCARVYVATGQTVRAGGALGAVGTTGPLKGPALYFAVRVGGEPVDPAAWLTPEKG